MTNDDDGNDDHDDYEDCFMIYTDSSSSEKNSGLVGWTTSFNLLMVMVIIMIMMIMMIKMIMMITMIMMIAMIMMVHLKI